MPTPKIWNNISKKLLPYWVIFAIVSVLSFCIILFFVLDVRFRAEARKDINEAIPGFISGVIYLWSFGLLLIVSWFKKISGCLEQTLNKVNVVKFKIRKFFEWYASIFLSIYFLVAAVFSFIILKMFFSANKSVELT